MSYFLFTIKKITSALTSDREYIIIPIIPIWAYLYIYTKTTLLITLLATGKNMTEKILQSYKHKKRIKQYTTLLTKIITNNQ